MIGRVAIFGVVARAFIIGAALALYLKAEFMKVDPSVGETPIGSHRPSGAVFPES